jgi:hypothetical protein
VNSQIIVGDCIESMRAMPAPAVQRKLSNTPCMGGPCPARATGLGAKW